MKNMVYSRIAENIKAVRGFDHLKLERTNKESLKQRIYASHVKAIDSSNDRSGVTVSQFNTNGNYLVCPCLSICREMLLYDNY